MDGCPPGYKRSGNVCTPISKERVRRTKKLAKLKSYTRASLNTSPERIEQRRNENLLQQSDPYQEFRKIGSWLYQTWKGRPDSPKWMAELAQSAPGIKVALEVAEELIDLQFDAAYAITQGEVAGKDQYGQVERERTESIGFKPIWTPGGFQV
tara:strand:+ start:10 stop:468 length:459 start_codon:yes stop_codon:yes gene_type:complete